MTSSVGALRCASLKLYGAVTGKEGYKNKSFQVREREREYGFKRWELFNKFSAREYTKSLFFMSI